MRKGIRIFLMPFSCTDVIERLQLQALSLEGGYFKRTYECSRAIDLGKGYTQPLGSGIYFILSSESFSAFHQLIENKVYHFYSRDLVELLQLSLENGLARTLIGQDLVSGHQVQYAALKNVGVDHRLSKGENGPYSERPWRQGLPCKTLNWETGNIFQQKSFSVRISFLN